MLEMNQKRVRMEVIMLIIAGITWYLNAEAVKEKKNGIRTQASVRTKPADGADAGRAGDGDVDGGCELV